MRVLVVFPPMRVSRDFIDYPYFANLGVLQAAAVLRASGHSVSVLDALACPGATLVPLESGEVQLGVSPKALLDPLVNGHRDEPDAIVVGLTPFHRPPHREPPLAEVLRTLRDALPETPLILADCYQSGQHVVDAPSEQILEAYPEIDALLRYEAEQELDRLIRRLALHGRPPKCEVLRGAQLRVLDELPLPAWDLVDVPAYFEFHESLVTQLGRPEWAFPLQGRCLPLVSSRGCPYKCVHCSSNPGLAPGEPKLQRRHSSQHLARQLDALVGHGADCVHILDELANVNQRHFDDLLGLLTRRRLRFEIPNGLRADHITERQLDELVGSITTLSISAESGVPRVLDEIVHKDLDLASIVRVCKQAGERGLRTLVHFMIGLPGETKAEINETLAYALQLNTETGAHPSVQFATPLPGTRLARLAADSLVNEPAPGLSRALPTVRDWGPYFQRSPSLETAEFSRAELGEFKATFDRRLEAGVGPKKAIMNVTYKCNNHCTFCAVGTRSQFDGNLDKQREFLIKYRRMGVELLDLDGGEPTLNPNLFKLVSFARRIGYRAVNVTTNGRLCTYEEFAKRLVNSGLTTLLFSIHGADVRTHAENVGVYEAFEQTITGVKNCARFAPEGVELGVNVTITKSNHLKIGELAQLVYDLGLRWLNIQFLTPFGRATSSVNPDTKRAAQAVMQVIDDWQERLRIQVINLPFCFMPGYEELLVGDLLKLERHMIFVNNEEVNLFEYLKEQRAYGPECASCTRKSFCGGFYQMQDVPEPDWLIAPSDLVRPIASQGLTPGSGNDARRARGIEG